MIRILNWFLFPFLTESMLFIPAVFVVYTDFSAVSTYGSLPPLALSPSLLRNVTDVPQACTSRPIRGAPHKGLQNCCGAPGFRGGGFRFCVPPPSPPVTTRFVSPPSAPVTPCVECYISYVGLAKAVERIHYLFFVCFCARHRWFPLSPTGGGASFTITCL